MTDLHQHLQELEAWRLKALRAEEEALVLADALRDALGGATVSYLRDEIELLHTQIKSLQDQLALAWATQ